MFHYMKYNKKVKDYCYKLYQEIEDGKHKYSNSKIVELANKKFGVNMKSGQITYWKRTEDWDLVTKSDVLQKIETASLMSRDDCDLEVLNRNTQLHKTAFDFIMEKGLEDKAEALALLKITNEYFRQKNIIDAKINNTKIETSGNEAIQINFQEIAPRVISDDEIERLENDSQ